MFLKHSQWFLFILFVTSFLSAFLEVSSAYAGYQPTQDEIDATNAVLYAENTQSLEDYDFALASVEMLPDHVPA